MVIHEYKTQYLSSKTYLIEDGRHGILIDPCAVPELAALISGRNIIIDHALLTHEHVDHIMGVEWVQHTFGPVVQCSAVCGERIQNSRENSSYYFELFKGLMAYLGQDDSVTVMPFSCYADVVFEGEKQLLWQGHTLLLKPTPGHSPGGICILLDNQYLFTGDTLMDDNKTVTSFVGGSMAQMQAVTLPWLRSLNRDIEVFPGHFACFPLGERLDRNIF